MSENAIVAALAEALAEHQFAGVISTRDGWAECLCGQHVPWTPAGDDDEWTWTQAIIRHQAAELARLIEDARREDRERLAGVEALADEWASTDWNRTPHGGCLDMYRHCAGLLRAVLHPKETVEGASDA